MKSTFFHALLIGLCLFLTLMFLYFDGQISRALDREKEIERQKEKAFQAIEEIQRTCKSETQLKILIEDFQRQATRILNRRHGSRAEKPLEKLYRKTLAGKLPPHDLALAAIDPFREKSVVLFYHSEGQGFLRESADLLFQGMIRGSLDAKRLTFLVRKMEPVLRFPCTKDLIDYTVITGLEVFNSLEAVSALYFSIQPGRRVFFKEMNNMVAAVFDLKKLSPNFGVKSIAANWKHDRSGVVFLPEFAGRPLYSSYFAKQGALRKTVVEIMKDQTASSSFLIFPNEIVCLGREKILGRFRLAVAFSLNLPTSQGAFDNPWFFLLSLWVLGGTFLFLIEKMVFGRTPRVSVGVTLLFVFLMVAGLPISGVNAISRFIISEDTKRESQIGARRLHQRLLRFDLSSHQKQAQMIKNLREVARDPLVLENLLREEKTGSDSGFLAPIAGQVLKGLPSREKMSFYGFFVAVGENNFFRSWSRIPMAQNEEQGQMLQVVFPISRKALAHAQKISGRPANRVIPQKVNEKEPVLSKEEVQFEMVRDLFIKILGGNTFFHLIYFPDDIQMVKMNLGRLYVLHTAVCLQGFPRFMIAWIWDDNNIQEAFSQEFLNPSLQDKDFQVYEISVRGKNMFSFPYDLESRHPTLYNLIKRSRETGFPMRSQIEQPTGKQLLESLPALKIESVIFAGRLALKDRSPELKEKFKQVVIASLSLAVFLAMCATWFFMAPLRRILTVMRQLRPGKYDLSLTDADRKDEFGTLAQAFNSMMNGLREKDMLGRYVSSSVKRVISDAAFQDAAREGQIRDVTVLFSGLHGFEEFQAEKSPEEVFRLMNDHLQAMNKAIDLHGGEVSKVMGEKIMVTFDHIQFGGGEKACRSALQVAKTIRISMASSSALPAIGINSGTVIAGIIGAPNVRLDYTVIGDTVNLASRLGMLAHIAGGTLTVLSGNTKAFLPADTMVEKLPFKRVKGKTQEVEAFLWKDS